jgi:hypothetical protein
MQDRRRYIGYNASLLGIVGAVMAPFAVSASFTAHADTGVIFENIFEPQTFSNVPSPSPGENVPTLFDDLISDWNLVGQAAKDLQETLTSNGDKTQLGILNPLLTDFQQNTAGVFQLFDTISQSLPVSDQAAGGSLANSGESLINAVSLLDGFYNDGAENMPSFDLSGFLDFAKLQAIVFDTATLYQATTVYAAEIPIDKALTSDCSACGATVATDLSNLSTGMTDQVQSGLAITGGEELLGGAGYLQPLAQFAVGVAGAVIPAVVHFIPIPAPDAAASAAMTLNSLENLGASPSEASELLATTSSLGLDTGQEPIIASTLLQDGLSMSDIVTMSQASSFTTAAQAGLVYLALDGITLTPAEAQLASEVYSGSITSAQFAQGFGIPSTAFTPVADIEPANSAPVSLGSSLQQLEAISDITTHLQADGLDNTAINAVQQSLETNASFDAAAYAAIMNSGAEGYGNPTEVASTLSTVIDAIAQGGNLSADVLAALPPL